MSARIPGPTNYRCISRAPGETGRSRLAQALKLPWRKLLWKSGALAPRQGANRVKGFSPRVPLGLKALNSRSDYAALKGPLFHVFQKE